MFMRITTRCLSIAASSKHTILNMGKKSCYAVVKGRQPGIYRSWEQCSAQVSGFKGNLYQGFTNENEAAAYLEQHGIQGFPAPNDASIPATTATLQAEEEQGLLSAGQPTATATGTRKKRPAPKHKPETQQEEEGITGTAPVHTTTHTAEQGTQDEEEVIVQNPSTRSKTYSSLRVEFDGASKNNPGPAGYGAVLYDAETGDEVSRIYKYMGANYTNNQAEYAGLIAGLEAALDYGCTQISVQGDSLLIINQVLGLWRVKNEGLRPYHSSALRLAQRFQTFKAKQVPRALNTVADALSNQAISEFRAGGGREDRWQPPGSRNNGQDEEEEEESDEAGRPVKQLRTE